LLCSGNFSKFFLNFKGRVFHVLIFNPSTSLGSCLTFIFPWKSRPTSYRCFMISVLFKGYATVRAALIDLVESLSYFRLICGEYSAESRSRKQPIRRTQSNQALDQKPSASRHLMKYHCLQVVWSDTVLFCETSPSHTVIPRSTVFDPVQRVEHRSNTQFQKSFHLLCYTLAQPSVTWILRADFV